MHYSTHHPSFRLPLFLRFIVGLLALFFPVIAPAGGQLGDLDARGPAGPAATTTEGSQTDTSGDRDSILATWSNLGDGSIVGCADCHYGGFASNPLRRSRNQGAFSKQNELKIWLEHDKHAVARLRIEPYPSAEAESRVASPQAKNGIDDAKNELLIGASNIRSWEMCRTLGYDLTTAAGYGRFRDNCLTCHGGYELNDEPLGFDKDGAQQAGLNCNYCHQEKNGNEAWVGLHAKPQSWRLLTPGEKSSHGMQDMVNMTNQARKCADCHVGNLAQGRFVTHSMYAAGHPPLPSFELETFCASMPQHWQAPQQLYQSMENWPEREAYFRTNYSELFTNNPLATPAAISWPTQKLMTGTVQSRRHYLQLLTDATDSEYWGDFALYDCSSCHHELRVNSGRQRRGFFGTPGRPPEVRWAKVQLELLLGQAYGMVAMQSVQLKLAQALNERPFGNPSHVESAAQQGMRQLDRVQQAVSAAVVDAGLVENAFTDFLTRLFAGLGDSSTATNPAAAVESCRLELLEYDIARNTIWTLQVLSGELRRLGRPLPIEAETMIAGLGRRDNGYPVVETVLPATQGQAIFRHFVEQDLLRRTQYDPKFLADQLARLKALLDRPSPETEATTLRLP